VFFSLSLNFFTPKLVKIKYIIPKFLLVFCTSLLNQVGHTCFSLSDVNFKFVSMSE
jgi:hypothetical protein